jgi:hypothetical protein
MKSLAALPLLAIPTVALAHPGHLATEAGHSHWVALAATLAAAAIVVIGIARALSRRRSAVGRDTHE